MFKIMTKMFAEMQIGFKNVNSEIRALKLGQEELKSSHEELKNEVSKHEEIILRRVK